jgi:lysophospholipase L1-like esterase
MLEEEVSSRGIEIINRSREGDTTFEGMRTFYEDIDPFRPDTLVLHFGVDDIYRPVYRSEFKENLVQITRLARQRFHPIILLLTSHPFENPLERDAADIYYRAIREVAMDLDCILVPVHLLWMSALHEARRSISTFVQSDPRLPNEDGHRIFAGALLERICGSEKSGV